MSSPKNATAESGKGQKGEDSDMKNLDPSVLSSDQEDLPSSSQDMTPRSVSSEILESEVNLEKRGRRWSYEMPPLLAHFYEKAFGIEKLSCLPGELPDTSEFCCLNISSCQKSTGTSHFVKHLQFTIWPDHGIPASAEGFIKYVRYVRKSHLTGTHPCSL
ncbi:Tyrosine-protein phosphatase non-receptor type 20 [Camelus dromedarius]|uniref:Tyrosine-protein phosphatase non-receptor type 20 n=1 Tax=Camelus dromedarius TaxID=9838 RepID=A0A5N4EEV2_CAMDR|nr:Tyrosine-protein phosphatase non-receptor type 20 [Camelus dromedarius]